MKLSVYGLLDSLRSNADGCNALLQNRLLNIASAIHTEYDLQLNEIDELKAQLVEVQDNRTGKAPCERFCEALVTKKMFDNLQSDNRQLKAQVERLRGKLQLAHTFITCVDETGYMVDAGFVDKETLAFDLQSTIDATPVQFLAEIKAQAVAEFADEVISHFEGCNYNLNRKTLRCYLNEQLRQQAKAG